jgi:hypothetical protein
MMLPNTLHLLGLHGAPIDMMGASNMFRINWYRSKVFAWRKNAASVVEAMTFFERGYLTKKFH